MWMMSRPVFEGVVIGALGLVYVGLAFAGGLVLAVYA
jgi:hypothetical protein